MQSNSIRAKVIKRTKSHSLESLTKRLADRHRSIAFFNIYLYK